MMKSNEIFKKVYLRLSEGRITEGRREVGSLEDKGLSLISYVRLLTPNVMIFEGESLWKLIRL